MKNNLLLVGILLAGSYVTYNLLTKKAEPKKATGKTEEVDVSGSFLSADASSSPIPSWAEPIFRRTWIV